MLRAPRGTVSRPGPAGGRAGSGLASVLGFPGGGRPHLAWDLLWVVLAGIAGAWTTVRLGCTARRAAMRGRSSCWRC